MAPRADLQAILEALLGSRNVYFQPPPTLQMKYPCIVYSRDSAVTNHADNNPYTYRKRYQVTAIGQDPDSDIPDKIAALPYCTFSRFYTADNLNHDVFNLFF
jgi:hypothetical protein